MACVKYDYSMLDLAGINAHVVHYYCTCKIILIEQSVTDHKAARAAEKKVVCAFLGPHQTTAVSWAKMKREKTFDNCHWVQATCLG
jgi:hypothetical protein